MARFFDLDDANATLPEVRDLLVLLREQRRQLIGLRDEVLERQGRVEASADAGAVRATRERDEDEDAELRRLRLRMQGVIDQMQAAVGRIDELGVTLRDIPTGLIDFPALVNGRQIWLCWRLGEGPIEWWHELTTGFGSRRPLLELE
jgi:hypothetical protein